MLTKHNTGTVIFYIFIIRTQFWTEFNLVWIVWLENNWVAVINFMFEFWHCVVWSELDLNSNFCQRYMIVILIKYNLISTPHTISTLTIYSSICSSYAMLILTKIDCDLHQIFEWIICSFYFIYTHLKKRNN